MNSEDSGIDAPLVSVRCFAQKIGVNHKKLVENANALIDQLKKIKPASAKGQYILGISVATTQGPGLKVDAK